MVIAFKYRAVPLISLREEIEPQVTIKPITGMLACGTIIIIEELVQPSINSVRRYSSTIR
jgi:hypothetical protein